VVVSDLNARLRCVASLLQQLNAKEACAAVNEAIAAISRSEVPAWQPIETAPTCEEVLVYVPLWRGPMPCMCVDGVWFDQNSHQRIPTHWMPLPDNPTPPTDSRGAE